MIFVDSKRKTVTVLNKNKGARHMINNYLLRCLITIYRNSGCREAQLEALFLTNDLDYFKIGYKFASSLFVLETVPFCTGKKRSVFYRHFHCFDCKVSRRRQLNVYIGIYENGKTVFRLESMV